MTKQEAIKSFIGIFSAIPTKIIVDAVKARGESLINIAPVAVGDEVLVDGEYATVEAITEGKNAETILQVEMQDTSEVKYVAEADIDFPLGTHDDGEPAHGFMYLIQSTDELYKRLVANPRLASSAGFEVYEIDEGLLLGVNSGGFDFESTLWTRLYDNLGLQFHD